MEQGFSVAQSSQFHWLMCRQGRPSQRPGLGKAWGAMVQLPSLLWGAVLFLLQCESASCSCQDSPAMGGVLAKVLPQSPLTLDLCMQGTEERHTP